MKKIFLDTNIFIRFFIETDTPAYQESFQLISHIENGVYSGYTSSLVLLETFFILKKLYQVPKPLVNKNIQAILDIKGLTVVEKTNFSQAFDLHKKTKVKLADCLISTQVPDKVTLVSFDKDFKKISKKWKLPKEILQKNLHTTQSKS